MNKIYLDKEEQALDKSLENGEWVPIDNMQEEMAKYQVSASKHLKKDKKINIRLSEWDYNKIKIRAAEEGLPYQTLLSSLIHKYITGRVKVI